MPRREAFDSLCQLAKDRFSRPLVYLTMRCNSSSPWPRTIKSGQLVQTSMLAQVLRNRYRSSVAVSQSKQAKYFDAKISSEGLRRTPWTKGYLVDDKPCPSFTQGVVTVILTNAW